MSEDLSIQFKIPPLWETINDIRRKIAADDRVKDNQDLLNATTMVASELLENAIKYGHHAPDFAAVEFNLDLVDREIRIQVKNAYHGDHSIEGLKRNIEKIRTAANPGDLYCDRLIEIANNPRQTGSGLGLFRIAYEGEFGLELEQDDHVVTVTARRRI